MMLPTNSEEAASVEKSEVQENAVGGEMPKEIEGVQKEESRDTPILIKTYGEFSNPFAPLGASSIALRPPMTRLARARKPR